MMQCRTCGDHGNLSLLDPEHAPLLPQLAAGCSVCHDCVVEIKHWSNFLHTFQTSQTRFQQVLHTQQAEGSGEQMEGCDEVLISKIEIEEHPINPESEDELDLPQIADVPLKVARVLVAKLLECDFCCFYTDNKTQLATHMQAHLHTTEGTRPTNHPEIEDRTFRSLKCAQCGTKYGDPKVFRWHTENCHGTDAIVSVIKISHNQHNYQCVFCQIVCKSMNLIMCHLSSQHKIKNLPFHCNFCDRQFVLRHKFMNHQLICRKTVSCNTAPTPGSGNQMQKKSVLASEQKCKMCSEIFKTEILLKNHIAQFHAVKRVHNKCVHCDEYFRSFSHLKSHCHTRHPGKPILQCEICNAGFSFYRYYLDHKKFKHTNYVLICNICKVEFSSYSGYRDHKKYKHQFHVLICNICKVEFTSSGGYWLHKKYKHGETRVFTCNICSASFSRPNNLRRHMRVIHCQLTKSFPCQFCSAKFKCETYLNSHVRNLHTGTILHCNHCKYNTRSKSGLALHLTMKHSLLKNTFACQFCSAEFKCKRYLSNHVLNLHTGKIQHCNHCKYNTRRKVNLVSHIRRCHL